MDHLIDNLARILATPMPRRNTFRLIGGAMAAAAAAVMGIQPVGAAQQGCTKAQLASGMFGCGNGTANSICCAPGTCCASHGNAAACCTRGQCTCSNGTCAASVGGNCPSGCARC